MPPRLRSNNANRRNSVMEIVVHQHRNDPEFLASLLRTRLSGRIRNTVQNHLNRIRNTEARRLVNRQMRVINVPRINRRTRSLMPHAIRLRNITPAQRLAIANAQNFINRNIRPFIQRIRFSPQLGYYVNPNMPGYQYRLMNNGTLVSRIGGTNFVLAAGVRTKGRNRLNY